MENTNLDNQESDGKKSGFMPFVLVFGGLIVILVLLKYLMDLLSK